MDIIPVFVRTRQRKSRKPFGIRTGLSLHYKCYALLVKQPNSLVTAFQVLITLVHGQKGP